MLEQFVIPVRGTREFGLDRAGIARLLMTVQLVDLAAIVPVGFVADRLGARRVLGVAALLVAAAVGLIAFGGLGGAVAGCVLFGLGMTGWMLPLSLLRSATPPERVGWRTALYRVAVDGGMFAGPFASGLLAGIAPGLLPTLLMGVLLGLGIFLLSMRPAPPMTQPAEPAR
jgi:MFS family permease